MGIQNKKNANRKVERDKARPVAKGYKQKYGVNYEEVFAPVARLEIIRLLVALAAQNRWPIHQMDVKSDLKQAPRAWYSRLDNYLQKTGFQDAFMNMFFM